MLEAAHATDVFVEGGEVRFTSSLFSPGWNWAILVPFEKGTISTIPAGKSVRVIYRLSTMRMLLIVTVAMLALGATVFFGSSKNQPPLLLFAIGWLWLFGMNYLIAAIRVPIWLKLGLRAAKLHPRGNFNSE